MNSCVLFESIISSQAWTTSVRNNRCVHLTIDNIAIVLPNHRPKPPPSTLTLIENNFGRKPRPNSQSR
jgi:hypothetical protein